MGAAEGTSDASMGASPSFTEAALDCLQGRPVRWSRLPDLVACRQRTDAVSRPGLRRRCRTRICPLYVPPPSLALVALADPNGPTCVTWPSELPRPHDPAIREHPHDRPDMGAFGRACVVEDEIPRCRDRCRRDGADRCTEWSRCRASRSSHRQRSSRRHPGVLPNPRRGQQAPYFGLLEQSVGLNLSCFPRRCSVRVRC